MNSSSIEKIAGVALEVVRQGTGSPVLFLHPHLGLHGAAPFIDALSAGAQVIAPAHPGFGKSELPAGMTTVEDLAYYYLDLMDELNLKDVTLVGASLGGWIASAIAVKNLSRIASLVLLGGVGVKLDEERKSPLVDVFSTPLDQLEELYFHNRTFGRHDIPKRSEEERATIARNAMASVMYAWNPYMCDIKLLGRLHRARVPALVLWGAQDRIAPLDYGRKYAAALPNATFETIEGAGHFPHIEQAAQTASRVLAFAKRGN
jgi:pimeloyl-ACP methyl ester carboxylesterase